MTDDLRDPLAPDPDRDVTPDAATLRVLAHPMRLALLRRLRQYGPATARQLAEHFGIDSGAASYHLRRLAAGGLIEEDRDRGTRRDRWWRARHRATFHDPAVTPANAQQDSRTYAQAVVHAYADLLRRVAGEVVPAMPDDWYAAAIFSDYTLRLTPGELNRMKRELVQVVARYRDKSVGTGHDSGSARVSVQLQAFPLPDSAEPPNPTA